jgi:hypothetical protein
MEISAKHINPYALPAPDSRESRIAAERRYSEEKAAAEKRSAESGAVGEYLGRERAVEGKTPPDMAQMLRQARAAAQGRREEPWAMPIGREPLAVQRALGAYRDNALSREYEDIELLPRVDDYV